MIVPTLVTLLASFASLAIAVPAAQSAVDNSPRHGAPQYRSAADAARLSGRSCSTNAACLARGLPLRRPATRSHNALRPRMSAGLIDQYTSAISYSLPSNPSARLGYLSAEFGPQGIRSSASSTRAGSILIGDIEDEYADPFALAESITSLGADNDGYPWLSFCASPGEEPGPASYAGGYALFTNAATRVVYGPSQTPNTLITDKGKDATYPQCESTVWSIVDDSPDGQVAFKWVTPGGEQVDAYLVMFGDSGLSPASVNDIWLTGDPAKFAAEFGEGYQRVNVYLERR